MAITTTTITDASIGDLIDPANGALVGLAMVAGPVHEPPQWDEGQGCWKSGYLTLCGELDSKPLYSVSPSSNGAPFTPPTNYPARPKIAIGAWKGGALAPLNTPSTRLTYTGRLKVVCVPRGSTWTLLMDDGLSR